MARTQPKARAMRVPDIRRGDQVLVLTGREAGKKGTVEHVVRNSQGFRKTVSKYGSAWRKVSPLAGVAVVVEGINIAKRHTKPRQKQGRTERQPRIQQGGILDVAQPILASKVMVICPHCSQPTRIKHGVAGDGRSVRLCTNCGETLNTEERKETRKK
jgi:large subunit ribosomal protein L24